MIMVSATLGDSGLKLKEKERPRKAQIPQGKSSRSRLVLNA